ncbi:hypothetical protein PS6_008145 [Mucor atramentarius]
MRSALKVSSDYEIAMKQGQEDVQQYFAYCVQLEEQLEKQKSGDKTDDRKFINKGITLDSMQENDTIVGSVAGKIKSAALQLYPNYKKSNANEKIIVCLGLNSCLDLSYQYPNGQSILFTASEWRALRNRFPKPSYPTNVYDDAVDIVRSAIAYDNKKSSRSNWTKMYKRIKKLEDQYDVELNEDHSDIGFALFFFSQLLKLINNNPELFDEQKEVSEQDFSVKFWSSILERLFVKSGLTLKW